MMFDSNSPDNPDGLDTYEHLFLSGQQVVETREGSGSTADQAETLQPKFSQPVEQPFSGSGNAVGFGIGQACEASLNIWSPRYIDALILRDENTDQDDTCDDDRVYYLVDANFNVTALVNTSGTVVERYLYTPYGEVTVLDSDFSSDADGKSDYSNTTLYTGRTFDPATGLYYYRHRVYHAQLGRFISRDPVGYRAGINLYAYVRSNPATTTDPTGLLPPETGWLPPEVYLPQPPPVPTTGETGKNKKMGGIPTAPYWGWMPECCSDFAHHNTGFAEDLPANVSPAPGPFGGNYEIYPYPAIPPAPIGGNGAGPCILLIVKCDTFVGVFHFFSGVDSPAATLDSFSWPSGCSAYICGGNSGRHSRCAADEVVDTARDKFNSVKVGIGNTYCGVDANGNWYAGGISNNT